MNGLYKIVILEINSDKIVAKVILDPNHQIFTGHYPGQPVLPGACMLQIVKDTLEKALNKKVALKQAPQIKFLLMVDPRENSELTINLNLADADADVLFNVSGNLVAANKPCLKFKGTFTTI